VLVLDDVSFECSRGEVAVIVGRSGAGKSTLLRCLNGLEPFESGEIRVDDVTITSQTHALRQEDVLRRARLKLGLVFQQFNLFPHLTALGNLIEAPVHALAESRASAVLRAEQLLDRVGLKHRSAAYPRQLSGGEQQRVAIARALMMRPDAMLFDEPTSALDPAMAGEVLAIIHELSRSGQTMIIVTHSLQFARRAATSIHVFAHGKRIESGTPEQIFEAPSHPITAAFIGSARDAHRSP
jgi:polar amino acid transport system permease protein